MILSGTLSKSRSWKDKKKKKKNRQGKRDQIFADDSFGPHNQTNDSSVQDMRFNIHHQEEPQSQIMHVYLNPFETIHKSMAIKVPILQHCQNVIMMFLNNHFLCDSFFFVFSMVVFQIPSLFWFWNSHPCDPILTILVSSEICKCPYIDSPIIHKVFIVILVVIIQQLNVPLYMTTQSSHSLPMQCNVHVHMYIPMF
jgi:hypothetical protein